jgi:hypothetical protein
VSLRFTPCSKGLKLSTNSYDGVWNETARFYREMVEAEGWSTHVGPIEIPIINDISNKVGTLLR